MNLNPTPRQEQNDEYLTIAVEWLLCRLERMVAADRAIGTPSSPRKRHRLATFFRRLLGKKDTVSNTGDAKLPKKEADASQRMNELAAANPPPALIQLGQHFHLSRFEMELLLFCMAMERDSRTAALCARAQKNPDLPYPTLNLAMPLFNEEKAWDVLLPQRPLRHWQLIEIQQANMQPLITSAISADETIVNYLCGVQQLDQRLASLIIPFDVQPHNDALPDSQDTAAHAIANQLLHSSIIQLVGPDSESKQLVGQRAASFHGLQPLRLPVGLLPQSAAEIEELARLWQRESILQPDIVLYLDAQEADETAPHNMTPLRRLLTRLQGHVLLAVRDVWPDLSVTTVVDVNKSTPAEQQEFWEAQGCAVDVSQQLASQFNLNVSTIRRIAGQTLLNAASNLEEKAAWSACLGHTRPKLDHLAQRLDVKATWSEITLPDEISDLLCQIIEQVRHRNVVYDDWGFRQRMNRGLGISVLFAGESGTGKTMAAEVLANELNLNLYRVDLSAVVDKYIGETEKNLCRLFDAAEDGGAVLFFDEADALFGKRSEVQDSHDRFANIGINYLLQRMEAFTGLAILATNFKSALDSAFVRRLRFIVNFPFPDAKLRQTIWEKAFPDRDKVEQLDYERLARFNLTGGSIQNIVLNTAFLAAANGTKVDMPLVLNAARTEYRKLERPFREADFR